MKQLKFIADISDAYTKSILKVTWAKYSLSEKKEIVRVLKYAPDWAEKSFDELTPDIQGRLIQIKIDQINTTAFDIYFKEPSDDLKEGFSTYGLCGIENHHLTLIGLIEKMYEWDENEHGVEAYIYDETKKDIEKLGGEMPKSIRRIK